MSTQRIVLSTGRQFPLPAPLPAGVTHLTLDGVHLQLTGRHLCEIIGSVPYVTWHAEEVAARPDPLLTRARDG